MRGFTYVYILRSQSVPTAYYVGYTENLLARLRSHNQGSVLPTKHLRPWAIDSAIAFTDPAKALAFEHYLKSGSGRAFAKRHF
jgi:putative endonuclease